MATPLNETREPEWKKAWTARNTLLSAPPLPILAIVGIVVFLLWVSSQLNNNVLLIHANSHNQRELVPLVFASVLTLIAQGTRLVLPAPSATRVGFVVAGFEGPAPLGEEEKKKISSRRHHQGTLASPLFSWSLLLFAPLLLVLPLFSGIISLLVSFHGPWKFTLPSR
ncbi:hypothetical protein D0Y65_012104 [Glycine soja]|uniref:Uncharacterized protein n=1 Tax=Glycine soja TaxID=3848 RepID=A0A445KMK9_GLYSO|nr:hypothetical protein D0Y65_012104 [Glycine soja]